MCLHAHNPVFWSYDPVFWSHDPVVQVKIVYFLQASEAYLRGNNDEALFYYNDALSVSFKNKGVCIRVFWCILL